MLHVLCCGSVYETMVQWFNDTDDSNFSSEDLPWMKDYSRTTNIENEVLSVIEIYVGDRGILLLTSRCKQFIFKREKMYQYLIEALEVWVTDRTVPCFLVTKVNNSGKAILGVDDTKVLAWWSKDGNKYALKHSTGDGLPDGTKPNPLLPPGGVSKDIRQDITQTSGARGARKNSMRAS